MIAPAKDLFPANSRHVVLHSTKVIELGTNFVKVDKASAGFESTINFDYAVLATVSLTSLSALRYLRTNPLTSPALRE